MVVLVIAFGIIGGLIGTVIMLCSLKVGGDYEDAANRSAAQREAEKWT